MQVKTFDDLTDAGLPVTTGAAFADMARYTERFIDAYYKMVAHAFRKADSHHLLIGSRWQPGTANSESLVRIAGKYMDVVSVNYYAYAIDKGFLKRLYKWSGEKPFFLSEWHYTSPSDSGLGGGARCTQSEGTRACLSQLYRTIGLARVCGWL